MGIGNIDGASKVSGGRMGNVVSVDSVSKGIENQIAAMQQKMQDISTKEDISVEEKQKERQELMQEINRLNTELRRRQAEMKREERKEALEEEMQEKYVLEETGRMSFQDDISYEGISYEGMNGLAAMDSSLEQARSQGKVIAQIEGGIAILKGEIKLDEARGVDVERKQEELARYEKKANQATASRFTILGEPADGVLLKNTNYSKNKNQETKQKFYTSLDIRTNEPW